MNDYQVPNNEVFFGGKHYRTELATGALNSNEDSKIKNIAGNRAYGNRERHDMKKSNLTT